MSSHGVAPPATAHRPGRRHPRDPRPPDGEASRQPSGSPAHLVRPTARRDRHPGRHRRPHPGHVGPPRRPGPARTPGGIFTGLGQIAGLFGAYLALVQLVLMSRSPWLEQVFGMDRLAAAHRWVGFACLWLLVGHGVMTTIGYSLGDGSSVIGRGLDAPDDLPLRPHGDGRLRALRRRRGDLRPRRPPPAVATRPGSASTSTPTWPSPSPSCTSSRSGPTSSTTRWPAASGSGSTS